MLHHLLPNPIQLCNTHDHTVRAAPQKKCPQQQEEGFESESSQAHVFRSLMKNGQEEREARSGGEGRFIKAQPVFVSVKSAGRMRVSVCLAIAVCIRRPQCGQSFSKINPVRFVVLFVHTASEVPSRAPCSEITDLPVVKDDSFLNLILGDFSRRRRQQP